MNSVQCELCPKACLLAPGESGDCRVRVNLDGRMTAVTYGFPCAVHVDPVEKKPLYHFQPGTLALSLATAGCNLHCLNCQNWEISQADPETVAASPVSPAQLTELAQEQQCRSIAYTYTDPVVFYEYTYDSARTARKAGLKNLAVSAGYINRRPLEELCNVIDAATIDVKAMSDKFYREVCGGTLKPVLEALVTYKRCGVWLEVSNLVLPTMNDRDEDFKHLAAWMKTNLGPETPLHFLRFFPHYRMRELPPTPEATLRRAREIAQAEGMKYVYIGNLADADAGVTRCPHCHRPVIERSGYSLQHNFLRQGKCPDCGTAIAGVWE